MKLCAQTLREITRESLSQLVMKVETLFSVLLLGNVQYTYHFSQSEQKGGQKSIYAGDQQTKLQRSLFNQNLLGILICKVLDISVLNEFTLIHSKFSVTIIFSNRYINCIKYMFVHECYHMFISILVYIHLIQQYAWKFNNIQCSFYCRQRSLLFLELPIQTVQASR